MDFKTQVLEETKDIILLLDGKNIKLISIEDQDAKQLYEQRLSSDFDFCIKTKENNAIGKISPDTINNRSRNTLMG